MDVRMNNLNNLRKEMNKPFTDLRKSMNKEIEDIAFERIKHHTLKDQEYKKMLAENKIEMV